MILAQESSLMETVLPESDLLSEGRSKWKNLKESIS